MEAAKAGPERPANKLSRKERRPVDDRERALLFGAEFGLGTLERVSRNRTLTRPAAWGGLLAVVVALVGGPVAAGVGPDGRA
jgi:hypothetical protein